jgi:hypothetical protein
MRTEDFNQIGLRGHDGVDVLIDTRHFVEPAESNSTPRSARSFLVALQVKDCIAFVRLITRPAPCDAECSDAGEPLAVTRSSAADRRPPVISSRAW